MKKQYLIFALAALLVVGCGSGGSEASSQTPQERTTESAAPEESTEGETTKSEQELAAEAKERKEKYIAECQPFQYKEFFRYEEKYKGTKVNLVLEVAQVMDSGLRCYSYSGDSFSTGDEYIIFDDRVEKDMRILQDDVITVWGEYVGSVEMTRAINDVAESIPAVSAKYISLMDETGDVAVPDVVPVTGYEFDPAAAAKADEYYEEELGRSSTKSSNPIIDNIFGDSMEQWSWQSDSTGYYLIPFRSDGGYQIWFTCANDTIWANTAFTVEVDEIIDTPSGGIACRGKMYQASKEDSEYNGTVEVTWASEESVDFCSVKMVDGHQLTDVDMVADDYSYYGITDDSMSKSVGTFPSGNQTMYVVQCQEFITLRSAPSTKAAEITKIPLYSSVSYVGPAADGFSEVFYNGQHGYVLAQYLDEYEPQVATGVTYEVINCKESITLRTSPSTKASEICQIPLGALVYYIEPAANGFFLVSYGSYTGYALSSYLGVR